MIILALVVLGGFTMCGKNDVVAHEEDPWIDLCGNTPIRFASRNSNLQTKTTTLEPGTHFGVFAFYQPGTLSPSAPGEWSPQNMPNFMFNEDVTYDGSYAYTPIKYWPNNEENTISFWGYCPYDAQGESPNPMLLKTRINNTRYTKDNESVGIPDVKFTVTNGQTDLLISDIEENQSYRGGHPASGIVTLHFHHALCKVDFKVYKANEVSDGTNITLKAIKLNYLWLTGIHNQEDNAWGNWSGDPNSLIVLSDGNYTLYKKNPDPEIETSPSIPSVMPMPQPLEHLADVEGVFLHVECRVGAEDMIGDYYLYGTGGITEWEKEKHYTYNIYISPGNPIIFSASVAPWDEDDGYVNIIK